LQRIASGTETELPWSEAVDAVSKARRRFYEAAKADIGIALGDVPESYRWQLSRLLAVDPTSPERTT
jgi:hypothetical protein